MGSWLCGGCTLSFQVGAVQAGPCSHEPREVVLVIQHIDAFSFFFTTASSFSTLDFYRTVSHQSALEGEHLGVRCTKLLLHRHDLNHSY